MLGNIVRTSFFIDDFVAGYGEGRACRREVEWFRTERNECALCDATCKPLANHSEVSRNNLASRN